MIYFIQAIEGGSIKIGTTISMGPRLTQLSREHKAKLIVLAIMPGDQSREAELHRQFGHLRMEGEWFDPAPDLIEFIRDHGRQWTPVPKEQPVLKPVIADETRQETQPHIARMPSQGEYTADLRVVQAILSVRGCLDLLVTSCPAIIKDEITRNYVADQLDRLNPVLMTHPRLASIEAYLEERLAVWEQQRKSS